MAEQAALILAQENGFEMPAEVFQVYDRDQAGFKHAISSHLRAPVNVPLELKQGRVLKAKEATVSREPLPPLRSEAMDAEHESMHEPQDLSLPHLCYLCFQGAREHAEREEQLRLDREAMCSPGRGEPYRDLQEVMDQAHQVHLNTSRLAKSCPFCQKLPGWKVKFPGIEPPKAWSRLPKPGEDGAAAGGQGIHVQDPVVGRVNIGMWNLRHRGYAAWYGYEVCRGQLNHRDRPQHLTKTEEKTIEERVRARLQEGGVAIPTENP